MPAPNFHFTAEDCQLALDALDALVDGGAPAEYLPVIASAHLSLSRYASSITGREVSVICAGLQLLLERNALDYRANQLLMRLRSAYPRQSGHT